MQRIGKYTMSHRPSYWKTHPDQMLHIIYVSVKVFEWMSFPVKRSVLRLGKWKFQKKIEDEFSMICQEGYLKLKPYSIKYCHQIICWTMLSVGAYDCDELMSPTFVSKWISDTNSKVSRTSPSRTSNVFAPFHLRIDPD